MSQPQPKTYSFLVVAPDYTDTNALKMRNENQAAHVEHMGDVGKAGILRTGGGSLAHDSYDFLNGAKLTGSIMIFESESIEAVRKIIEDDVYWTEPVWDHEKLQIIPFFSPAPIPPLMA
ncbi:hypothetical protein BC629DRAFT_1439235 [Irpex lacteus]|nr:hypothetical protein BC629DRAFT_1439235 [Irpex lacteus]